MHTAEPLVLEASAFEV